MITTKYIGNEEIAAHSHSLTTADHNLEDIACATFVESDTEVSRMTIDLFGDAKIGDLQQALKRALNTWENAPPWLMGLADMLDPNLMEKRRQSAKTS